MSLLQWTQELNTGIAWIDEQHQQIVHYINDLHDAKQARETGKIGEVMENLIQYTVTHFAEEEKMMERAGYPLTEVHKGVHKRFVEKVGQMNARHKIGIDTSEELLNLLEGWLFSHIRVNDNGYVSSVKGAGADKR
ncbi:MAG: bacteriohemerythrin [Candidatus Competibacteraceae bacterium]|nr:bacteriohemerythrin [Candidatus Competibacteraceae bacterium]